LILFLIGKVITASFTISFTNDDSTGLLLRSLATGMKKTFFCGFYCLK